MRVPLFRLRALLSGTPILPALLPAAEPVLTHLHPAAVQAGTTAALTLTGKFDPWPCGIRTETPGLVFRPGKEAGKFEVTVDASVPPGPHLVRACNAEGASAPVAFAVTRAPQTAEAEPNNDFRSPQLLELNSGPGGSAAPVTVNGRLDQTGDVDCFALHLTKDRPLVAWVQAHVLAAGVDAMLRLTDEHGTVLAFNHDGPLCMDPLLVFHPPADGRYILQVMGHKYPAAVDIRFEGGPDCVYRLHLSSGPVIRHCWPLAVPAGHSGPLAAGGWNLPAEAMPLPPSDDPSLIPPPAAGQPGKASIPVLFPPPPGLPAGAELTEKVLSGQSLPPAPWAVSGRISQDGEEDRYSFPATKGEVLEITAASALHGGEADPWLRILDSQGRELATNDDDAAAGAGTPGTHARLLWTAPEDGTFTLAIGDLTRRGGPAFYYRLLAARPRPRVEAVCTAHAFKIQPGKTAEVSVQVTFLHGFSAPLFLAPGPLPPGLTATPATVPVPEKGGAVTLTLSASPDAAASSVPFRPVLLETPPSSAPGADPAPAGPPAPSPGGPSGSSPVAAPAGPPAAAPESPAAAPAPPPAPSQQYPVQYRLATVSENNGVPQGFRHLLLNATGTLWLTVLPPPSAVEPAK